MCRSSQERWYLESLITIFRLHHLVNYQHISFAVLELSRWLSSVDRDSALFHPTSPSIDDYFCCICRKYLLQVTRALFIRIFFYGGWKLESNNEIASLYEFCSCTFSSLLSSEIPLVLSIWCDYSSLYQYEKESSWDIALESIYPTNNSDTADKATGTTGVHSWKAVWIRPNRYVKWLQGYKPCIVSFIMEIHRNGRLGRILKAKDAKTGVHYWVCCVNWLYTVVWMMPSNDTLQDIRCVDNKISLWIKEFCWNLQRISAPDIIAVQ